MSTATATGGVTVERIKLGVFALCGLGFLGLSLPAFAEPMTFWTRIVLGEYSYPGHELHHFVLGSVPAVLLLGVSVQAYRPSDRIGALYSVILIWLSLTVVFGLGGEFSPIHLVLLGLLVGMAVTHPTGPEQLPDLEGFDSRMAVIAGVTAVGGLAFAGTELSVHFSAADTHVGFGHYLFMATTGLSVAGLAVYASARGTGWRFPAYTAAFLMAVVGLGSVVYPGAEQGSSLGVVLGAVVVLWALVFVLVAEGDKLLEGTRS